MAAVYKLTGMTSGLEIGLGWMSGGEHPAQMINAYARAYRRGDLAPGCRRILAFSDDREPAGWEIGHLQQLVDTIAACEGAGRCSCLYCGAIVANTDRQAVFGELYCVLWALRSGAKPRYIQARDLPHALEGLCETSRDAEDFREQVLSMAAGSA